MRNPTGGNGSPRVPRRSGVAGLYAVPVLVELEVDPDSAGVPDESTRRVLQINELNNSVPLIRRLSSSGIVDQNSNGNLQSGISEGRRTLPDLDDISTVEEVAAALHVPRSWIIRRARRLPFVIRLSRKKFVCSRTALQRWLASRPGHS